MNTEISNLKVSKNTANIIECMKAASSFFDGNFGTFYEHDESPIIGHEFGEYRSKYGPIHIHREGEIVVLYFPFER